MLKRLDKKPPTVSAESSSSDPGREDVSVVGAGRDTSVNLGLDASLVEDSPVVVAKKSRPPSSNKSGWLTKKMSF